MSKFFKFTNGAYSKGKFLLVYIIDNDAEANILFSEYFQHCYANN